MQKIVMILFLFSSLLVKGQENFISKIDNDLKPIKLPKKISSHNDTIIGWGTLFKFHLRNNIAINYHCVGANNLQEYVAQLNKKGEYQLDRRVLLDTNGSCYDNLDLLVARKSNLPVLFDYSITYDSSFNIIKIKYREPEIINSEKALLKAHEDYLWKNMQFGKWLIDAKKAVNLGNKLPVHNFKSSPRAIAINDSIRHLEKLYLVKKKRHRDSIQQQLISNHKLEIDSCESFYQNGQITKIKNCLDCYYKLFSVFRYSKDDGLPRTIEINKELYDLTLEFALFIYYGDKAYKNEEWEEAIKSYQKALELDEVNPYALKRIEEIKQLIKSKKN